MMSYTYLFNIYFLILWFYDMSKSRIKIYIDLIKRWNKSLCLAIKSLRTAILQIYQGTRALRSIQLDWRLLTIPLSNLWVEEDNHKVFHQSMEVQVIFQFHEPYQVKKRILSSRDSDKFSLKKLKGSTKSKN